MMLLISRRGICLSSPMFGYLRSLFSSKLQILIPNCHSQVPEWEQKLGHRICNFQRYLTLQFLYLSRENSSDGHFSCVYEFDCKQTD
jgi:hypothetical protein